MESGGCSWLLLLKDRLPNLKASKIMKTSIKNNLKSMGPGFILWQPNSIFLKNKILRQTPWVMEKILDFCKKNPWFLWKKSTTVSGKFGRSWELGTNFPENSSFEKCVLNYSRNRWATANFGLDCWKKSEFFLIWKKPWFIRVFLLEEVFAPSALYNWRLYYDWFKHSVLILGPIKTQPTIVQRRWSFTFFKREGSRLGWVNFF